MTAALKVLVFLNHLCKTLRVMKNLNFKLFLRQGKKLIH